MSSPPIVAIVGRPNVGKSTLFNRLTGTRAALVSDLPGLTRDRREGDASILGSPIRLFDTAGLEEAAAGSIADRMRRQTEAALTDANLILFVVDAKAGITPADVEFSKIVRATGQPVILVANKCEGRSGKDGFYEAFALGLGDPIGISAEHGEGLGDLEADIAAALGIERQPTESRDGSSADGSNETADVVKRRPLRVAIVGRPNAGKSTLVNTLLGQERMITGPEPGLTRDSVATDFDWRGHTVRLFDTAGLRRQARIHETAEKLSASDAVRAIRFAEVIVLLLDAEHPLEHQDLTIGELATNEGRALVIAINKWDLIEDKQKRLRDIRSDVEDRLSQVMGVSVLAVSAQSGKGLDQLMAAVVKAHEIWNKRVPTPALNRWLEVATGRHSPPAARGRRIRLRYITQPSTRPPTFVTFCSIPEALPGSYLRYLTNSLREAFDLPGVPIRFNLRKGENPYAKIRKRR